MRTILLALLLPVASAQVTMIHCASTVGDFHIKLDRSYSPKGVDRFIELVDDGFFSDMLLYRVIPGFLVQFGVAAMPAMTRKWTQGKRIQDEPNKVKFRKGTVSFAGNGKDSRDCHVFVALEPNGANLGGAPHEATLGHVVETEVFEKVARNFQATGYPDTGSLQGALVQKGNIAASDYPKLDRIIKCGVMRQPVQASSEL